MPTVVHMLSYPSEQDPIATLSPQRRFNDRRRYHLLCGPLPEIGVSLIIEQSTPHSSGLSYETLGGPSGEYSEDQC